MQINHVGAKSKYARDSDPWDGTHANGYVDFSRALAGIRHSTSPFWLFRDLRAMGIMYSKAGTFHTKTRQNE